MISLNICSRCGYELRAGEAQAGHCVSCHSQSFWQKTKTIVQPQLSGSDDWWTLVGVYLYFTGLVLVLHLGFPQNPLFVDWISISGGRRGAVGILLSVWAGYTLLLGIILFAMRSVSENRRHRCWTGLAGLSVPAWAWLWSDLVS